MRAPANPRPAWLLLVLAAALAGCSKDQTPPAKPALPVRVESLSPTGDDAGTRYSATVAPWAQVEVAAKVNGYVRAIQQLKSADGRMRDVDAGDAVRKGVQLARIEDSDYQDRVKQAAAGLLRAEASLQKSTADWRRARDLWATQSITAPDHDKARWEYESGVASVASARAQLDEARTSLGYTSVAAPLTGVMIERKAEVGALVGPGTTLFVVADMSVARVNFGVPDVALARIALGTPLAITTESLPGRRFEGKVTSISPSADSKTRVYQVQVTVPNPKAELRDGMIAVLDLPPARAAQASALTVPLAALLADGAPDRYMVYTVAREGERELARKRPVEVGQVRGNRVVVVKGLGNDERVIVAGHTLVREGDAVRVVP